MTQGVHDKRPGRGRCGLLRLTDLLCCVPLCVFYCLSVCLSACCNCQAGYRAEKFGIFPHVDSPAALIKSLAGRGSQAATQGGTQAGSQGV